MAECKDASSEDRAILEQQRTRMERAWKLCCAAELVFARRGMFCTVNDVISEARVGRASYYESFCSLLEQLLRMNRAACSYGGEAYPAALYLMPAFPYGASVELIVDHEGEAVDRMALVLDAPFVRPEPCYGVLFTWYSLLTLPLPDKLQHFLDEQSARRSTREAIKARKKAP
jgi:hypothetical protein